jgi:hypothetical protein
MPAGKTYKFFGSEFKLVTGYGAPKNITGISNADPCVVTVVAHGIVKHGVARVANVLGMLELNDRLFAVERVTVDTLRLVGVDSTNYGVWSSGGTIVVGTTTAHCEQTSYSFDSGATTVTEDETNCGISTNVGSPKLGTLSLGFKTAENAFQDSIEASRRAASEVAFAVQVKGQVKVRYDIGYVTQAGESGSAGGTWDSTASVQLTQHRIKVDA